LLLAPHTSGVAEGSGVLVRVAVLVAVFVDVKVGPPGVIVAVLVRVLVAVLVFVRVAVFVEVLVGVMLGPGVFVGQPAPPMFTWMSSIHQPWGAVAVQQLSVPRRKRKRML
jgi:hypothetical protein